MHKKPTVFFSHSSIDRATLGRLRSHVVANTGSTVDVFLSSDGQSIPLGRNWVHRVEEALSGAKVMFVFLSPASLSSGWVFFESGYAYSRGIRVIPVAIFGVDLGHIPPPLGLLQGFNLTAPDSAANIIAVINEEFEFSFSTEFTAEEYEGIFGNPAREIGVVGQYADLIKSISVTPHADGEVLLAAALSTIQREDVEHVADDTAVSTFGLAFQKGEPMGRHTSIDLDASVLHVTLPLLQRVLHACGQRPASERISILFHGLVRGVGDDTQQSGRLLGSGVRLLGHDRFAFDHIEFAVSHWFAMGGNSARSGGASLTVQVPNDRLRDLDLKPLLGLLFERGVLRVHQDGDY